jgi:exoribonuclease R
MPPPDEVVVKHLRRLALALGIDWPKRTSYAEVVRGIDRGDVRGVVFLRNAGRALRGASYHAFDGTPPPISTHAAVAAPYAHVTAPLRRLADRFANVVVLALCTGADLPSWARAALPTLPQVMDAANRRSHDVDRAVVDEVEALLLSSCIGAVLDATVVSVDKAATVAIADPIVVARSSPAPEWKPGATVRVRVVAADVDTRRIELVPA